MRTSADIAAGKPGHRREMFIKSLSMNALLIEGDILRTVRDIR
ncbi:MULTISPECIES: hypothetical protein [Dickeya]|nr:MULTISPECIES: hypothetical protein [Dickeya]